MIPCVISVSQGATILDRQAVTIGIDDTARGSSRRQRPVLQGLTCGAIVLAEELVAVVARPHEGLDDCVEEEEGAVSEYIYQLLRSS